MTHTALYLSVGGFSPSVPLIILACLILLIVFAGIVVIANRKTIGTALINLDLRGKAASGSQAEDESAEVDEETIAAVSAAVAAFMEASSPGIAYRITNLNRSAWTAAGAAHNTQPF